MDTSKETDSQSAAAATSLRAPCPCDHAFDSQAAYDTLSADFRELVDALSLLLAGSSAQQEAPARTKKLAQRLERIVGGRTTNAYEFPECCCIGGPGPVRWFCSGVLITPQVVLTAAHCTGGAIDTVLAGAQTIFAPDVGESLPVREAVVHPDYHAASSSHDLALLVLDRASRCTPARLAQTEHLVAADDCHLVGFGYNDPVKPYGFGVKRHVNVPIAALDRSNGADALPAELAEDARALGFSARLEFVAGRKHLGRDTCNGDSGGPVYLYVNGAFLLAGITSRATRVAGAPCGDGGVYVRLDRYRDWIEAVLVDRKLVVP
jgi:endonuclease G, mitochondrial